MRKFLYLVSIVFICSFGHLTLSAAEPLNYPVLQCKDAIAPSSTSRKNSNLLPKTAQEWTKTYHKFPSIAEGDQFYYNRIVNALNSIEVHFNRKKFRKLLIISQEQNRRFIEYAETNPKKTFFYLLESSYLKMINDEIGKDNSTSQNFMAKMELITSFIEALSKLNDAKVNMEYLFESWMLDPSESHFIQSDFKALTLMIPFRDKKMKAIFKSALSKAMRSLRANLEHNIAISNPELVQSFYKNRPEFLDFNRLYNDLTADSFTLVNQFSKYARLWKDISRTPDASELQSYFDENIVRFDRLSDIFIDLFGHSSALVESSRKGRDYPTAKFFEVLRKTAPVARNRDKRESDVEDKDNTYFLEIKSQLDKIAGTNRKPEEIHDIVDLFHETSSLVSRLAFIKTEPMDTFIRTNKFVFSADLKNGGGLELSLVSKHLIDSRGQAISKRITAIKMGVDETTNVMNQWAKTLENIILTNTSSTKVTIQRSGEDFLAIFDTQPLESELARISEQIAMDSFVYEYSRITLSNFHSGESVPDGVAILETIEKNITKAYNKQNLSPLKPQPILWVSRVGSDVEVRIQNQLDQEQLLLLKKIVEELSKDQSIRWSLVPLADLAFSQIGLSYLNIA